MKKKILFLDGDGTLWYPESTRHTIAPHWIYSDEKIGANYLEHMVVIPSVIDILQKLKSLGIILILISTHPHLPEEAIEVLKGKVEYFKLGDFFDEFYATQDHPDEKGKVMERILKEKKIPKSMALMVGDSYRYDYLSARKVGIDALLIKTKYMKHPSRGRKVSKTIESVKEVLNFV